MDETSERSAHVAPLAHPRAHPRLPSRGCVGASYARWSGRAPSAGVADCFGRLPDGAPLVVRTLWEARWKIGALLRWDSKDTGVGFRVNSLRERLPSDLRAAPRGPDFAPFTSVYQLENEWAAEMANRTVHAVMHIGWVLEESAGYRGQMAVLVKPNGPLGAAYMAAIKPFRHLIVYPALMRWIEQRWLTSA
jgi:Protein of unknown function (DUF2867)